VRPLGDAVQEAVQRCLHRLVVVGGAEAVGERPGELLDDGDRQTLEGGDGDVAVEVVAVRGVGAGPDPHAWIGERQLGARQQAGEAGGDPDVGLGALLQPQRAGRVESAALQPRRDQLVVVVAGDEDHAGRAHGVGEIVEEGAGDLERLAERPVAELDHVAEQHDLVGTLHLAQEDLPEARAADEIAVESGGEMEVGYDERAHEGILSGSGRCRNWTGGRTITDPAWCGKVLRKAIDG
jgi:hypothetical protein